MSILARLTDWYSCVRQMNYRAYHTRTSGSHHLSSNNSHLARKRWGHQRARRIGYRQGNSSGIRSQCLSKHTSMLSIVRTTTMRNDRGIQATTPVGDGNPWKGFLSRGWTPAYRSPAEANNHSRQQYHTAQRVGLERPCSLVAHSRLQLLWRFRSQASGSKSIDRKTQASVAIGSGGVQPCNVTLALPRTAMSSSRTGG